MKKNKILTTALMVSALTIGSLVPASAGEELNNIAQVGKNANTKVEIQVVHDANQAATLSVEVPTVLAISVVADETQATDSSTEAPSVMLPNSTAVLGQGTNVGVLPFVNRSLVPGEPGKPKQMVPAYINGVTVHGGEDKDNGWLLVNSAGTSTGAKTVSITVADQVVNGQGSSNSNSKSTTFNKTILLPGEDQGSNTGEKTEGVKFTVNAGGVIDDYKDTTEGYAHAFTLEWNISLTPAHENTNEQVNGSGGAV